MDVVVVMKIKLNGKVQTQQDDLTMKKVSAMAQAQQEEQEMFRK